MTMKRMTALMAVTVAAAALQAGSAAAHSGQDPVTVTGCLRTGSAPSVFILRGATDPVPAQPDDAGQMPRDYLLVAIPGGIDAAANLNTLVAITGVVSSGDAAPPPPEAANSAERALRRISVQALRQVAPKC
jgi:hypothetical protein